MGYKEMVIKDQEIVRIKDLLDAVGAVEDILVEITDEKEYRRVRDYVNERTQINGLPYTSPFIKKVDKKS